MSRILLTTTRAAELLQVHESTVKRWCNDGTLSVSKTPGGHRRIELANLLDFAKQQSITLPLQAFPSFEEDVWRSVERCVEEGDFSEVIALMIRWLSSHEPQMIEPLWLYMSQHAALSAEDIMDHCVQPLMFYIGREWEAGRIDIGEEHLYTQIIVDALHTLRQQRRLLGESATRFAPRALVGCAEGEQHQIGALCVRILLESLGWDVLYLGANVPIEAYARAQRRYKASLVCISFVPPRMKADAMRCVRVLSDMYQPAMPYRLVLGGSALEGFEVEREEPFLDLRVFTSMERFRAWVLDAYAREQIGVEVQH